jgi:ferredoxin
MKDTEIEVIGWFGKESTTKPAILTINERLRLFEDTTKFKIECRRLELKKEIRDLELKLIKLRPEGCNGCELCPVLCTPEAENIKEKINKACDEHAKLHERYIKLYPYRFLLRKDTEI